jgi:DNA-binding transcriptional LysR family regulator
LFQHLLKFRAGNVRVHIGLTRPAFRQVGNVRMLHVLRGDVIQAALFVDRLCVQVSGRIRLNSLDGVRPAVLQGLGIGYLPAWMDAEALRTGELIALLTEHAAPGTPVSVLHSAERLLPRRAAVFIEFITEVLGNVPGPHDTASA